MTELSAAIEAALASRKGRKRGDEIDFSCVEHEDNTPSASWNQRKEVWKCQSCGEGGNSADLAKRLGIHVETPRERAERGQIVAEYDYRDEQGTLLFQVVRFQPKDFRQRRPVGGGTWEWKSGTRQVLYRLPEFLKATDERAYIPEGEKDVENLIAQGMRSTTSPGGAVGRKKPGDPIPRQKWRSEFNKFFRGLEVVLPEDNDDAGYCFTQTVARELHPVAKWVKILRLPGLPPKGDISDWFLMGGTAEELRRLVDEAPKWEPPESQDEIGVVGFPETDAGNAELFAHLYGDRIRFDHGRSRWLVWGGHRWVPDIDGQRWRWAVDAARMRARAAAGLDGDRARDAFRWAKISESTGKIEAMLRQAEKTAPISDKGLAWDANPLLLGCENGVVNLATGELRPGRRDDRITLSTGLHFDPNAPCPRWDRFISEVFPDAEVRSYIRLILGYAITGMTREQFWCLCYGKGANGKSTMLNTIRRAAGEYGHVMAFSTIEKGKESAIPADLAALAGKRIVTVSEAGEYSRINEERVKMLTGQEEITARELYKPQFSFRPELLLLVAVNHKPDVRDDSVGYWRRLRLVPFTQTFPVSEDVEATLANELPGILRWLVEASTEWYRKGFPRIPATIAVETIEYRDQANPYADFITDCCVITDLAAVPAASFYKAYKAWAEEQGYGQREISTATTFGRRMSEAFKRRKSVGVNRYEGIGLKSDGWTPTLPIGEGYEIGEGLVPENSLGDCPSRREFSGGRVNPPQPSPCDCDEKHHAELACEGLEYWAEDDGSAHCPVCHPDSAVPTGDITK